MTPRRPSLSSVSAGARKAAVKLRWAVLGGTGGTAALWIGAVPPLSMLPFSEWPIYGAAALLLGTVLFLGVAAATQRLGQPGTLTGGRRAFPDEVVATLSVFGVGALCALGFSLLAASRVGAALAAAILCLHCGLLIAGALCVGVLCYRQRAPLSAPSPPRGMDSAEGAAALSYSTALGTLATGFILSGWLLCAGFAIGQGQASAQRRSAILATDLAAIVATAAVHHHPIGLMQLVRALSARIEPHGFVVVLDANSAVVPLPGGEGKGRATVLFDPTGARCRLGRGSEGGRAETLPCAVRALPPILGSGIPAVPQPLRVAAAVLMPQSTLPFAAGALGAALLIGALGLLIGRAAALDSVRDLERLAEDIDSLDGAKGAQGLLLPLSSLSTPEISQLQAALCRLRAQLFDEVCRYEQALSRAEDADRRKTEFIGDVGRELRAPLSEILTDVRHLLAGDDGPLSDKQRDDVQIIQQGAQHLLELLRDVLDVSVLQGGLRIGRRSAIDVSAIARDLIRSMRPLVSDNAVTLRLEVKPGTPRAYADGPAVRRILGNLLSNAVKFTTSGEITIELGPEELPIDGGLGHALRVTVRDTGPGIPSADLHKLFTEYTQLGTSPEPVAGTGLGLAIARRLCELHGGTIDVKSALGHGSIFGFTLPESPEKEPPR